MIVKAKGSQSQLTRMQEIVGQLKKGKDSASQKVKRIETALESFISKIRVDLLLYSVLIHMNSTLPIVEMIQGAKNPKK